MTFDIDSAAQAQVDAKARRERIAIKCMQSVMTKPLGDARTLAVVAVHYADALIAELDKEEHA